MATYIGNCYSLLEAVREGVNENSTPLLQGTSTSGKYQNSWLIQKINESQRLIHAILLK